jgi:hypothetical protein
MLKAGERVARRLFVLILIASLIASGCSTQAPETNAPIAGAEGVDAYNVYAQFLAGLPVRADSPFRHLEDRPEWKEYASLFDAKWKMAEVKQFEPVDAFQQRELAPLNSRSDFVFYPFGGPDVIYVTRFFPGAKLYILCGLEPVGDIRTAQDYELHLNSYLKIWTHALASIFNRSFFVTSEMDRYFRGRAANGLLPVICLLLARSGHTIDGVQFGRIDDSGKFIPEIDTPDAQHMGVQIRFHNNSESIPRTLCYFSGELGIGFTTSPGFSRYLRSLGTAHTLIKSGSFLLHGDDFSALRAQILETSDLILEDDSGIPYRYFTNPPWHVQLFGDYGRPDRPFQDDYQKDLAADFQDPAKVKAMGFSLGYDASRRQTSLILAWRTSWNLFSLFAVASHFVIFGNSKYLAKIRQVKDRDCQFPRSNARKNRVRMANLAAKSGLSF